MAFEEPRDSGPDTSATDGPSRGDMPEKVCAGCGKVNEPTSDFCYKCGLKLPDVAQPDRAITEAAGFGIRLAAWVADAVLLLVIETAVLAVYGSLFKVDLLARARETDQWFLMPEMAITFVVEAAYWTLTIGRWGRTIGKALLRLKVVRADGARVSYERAFARYLSYLLSWFAFGLGFLLIALHPRKRGLHDLICDTRVVRDRR